MLLSFSVQAEILMVKNTDSGEENVSFPVYLHCILSLAKLSVGVNHICNAFPPFFPCKKFYFLIYITKQLILS